MFDPPLSNYPGNVHMEVCLYGSPNLPLTSPVNANMKLVLDTWHTRCSRLANYDYALLLVDYWQQNPLVPVPMVSGLVGTARYLAGISALDGGSQALLGAPQAMSTMQYNPWDFYAYPRIRWNTSYTVANLESEFFTGYYREAAAPMLAYYKAMEEWQLTNNVDLHFKGYCYWVAPGAFPRFLLNQMQTNLQAAESLATNWYVINRVNDAKNSWGYCCASMGITDLTKLTNFSDVDTVSTNGTNTVNLASITVYGPLKALGGNYYSNVGATWNEGGVYGWHTDGATMMQKTLNFTTPGNYRVDVVSYCNYYNNGFPAQRVWLGGTCSGSITITNTTAATNSFIATVSSPTALDLVVSQDNSGKFLVVSKIQITKL